MEATWVLHCSMITSSGYFGVIDSHRAPRCASLTSSVDWARGEGDLLSQAIGTFRGSKRTYIRLLIKYDGHVMQATINALLLLKPVPEAVVFIHSLTPFTSRCNMLILSLMHRASLVLSLVPGTPFCVRRIILKIGRASCRERVF